MAEKHVWEIKTSINKRDEITSNQQKEYMKITETKWKLKLLGLFGVKYTKKETILVSQP